MRRLEGNKEEAKKPEDAFLTKRKYDFECLSCGRGTSPAPPYKEATAKDAIMPAFKVGPGFSKILNFLQTVATPEELRRSEGEAPESRRHLQSRPKVMLPKVPSLKSQRSTKDFKSS